VARGGIYHKINCAPKYNSALFALFGQKVPKLDPTPWSRWAWSSKNLWFLRDQRIGDPFVNGQKPRISANKSPIKNIDLLSPGENFSISDHFTNFSWPIARWYKNIWPIFRENWSNKNFFYFFNKYEGFYPKNSPPKNHPDQSNTLFFDFKKSKTPKKIFSTVTLSSTNSGPNPPYKYLAHGRGTCTTRKKAHFPLKWRQATPVYDEIVDEPKANNSPHTNDVKFAHSEIKHFLANSPIRRVLVKLHTLFGQK